MILRLLWLCATVPAFVAGAAWQSQLQSKPDKPPPLPPMQTVGVRGAIDGGGYSAPAAAKVQSEMTDSMIEAQLDALKTVYSFNQAFDCEAAVKMVRKPDKQTARAVAIADLQARNFAAVPGLLSPILHDENDCSLRDLVGLAEEFDGRLEAAAEQFRLAAACSQAERDYFAHGVVLLLLDNVSTANDVFTNALTKSERPNLLRIGLALVLYQTGQTAEALDALLRIAETEPSYSMPYVFITQILSTPGGVMSDDTVARLEKLVDSAPRNPPALVALAYASSHQHAQRAEDLLKRALAIDPAFIAAHTLLGSIYAARDQYVPAIGEFRKALDENPDLVELHYKLGQVYLRNGQKKLGEKELAEHQSQREIQDGSHANLGIRANFRTAWQRIAPAPLCGTSEVPVKSVRKQE
ncbi:MAG TPA: tetratricopeptide repeat protein [Bryobacteraceae bacterium]|nr:tetratricopeptide repeat protein [Bryobacteraceae bacterium]